MKDDYEIYRLQIEAGRIKDAMLETRKEIRKASEELQQKRIDTRTMPPMSQMTRIQKRYFLEPWMTTLTFASWGIAVVGFCLAMFTPWHVEWSCFGTLLTLVGVGFLITKLNFMDWNSRTEGEVRSRGSRDYGY